MRWATAPIRRRSDTGSMTSAFSRHDAIHASTSVAMGRPDVGAELMKDWIRARGTRASWVHEMIERHEELIEPLASFCRSRKEAWALVAAKPSANAWRMLAHRKATDDPCAFEWGDALAAARRALDEAVACERDEAARATLRRWILAMHGANVAPAPTR